MSWGSVVSNFPLIYGIIKSNYTKLRMFLACCKEKKVIWNLKLNLDRIKDTIKETDPKHFLHRIENLYPKLRRYEKIYMPLVEPSADTGIKKYDSTWLKYHSDFLKRLIIDIEDDTFDLEKWNADVKKFNQERAKILFVNLEEVHKKLSKNP